MIIYDDFEQGTDEWHAIRRGVATASKFKTVMVAGKGSKKYMCDLIGERITNYSEPMYKSAAMEHGNEIESQAVANYEFCNDMEVKKVAFIKMNEFIGYSPDGLVGDDGIVEAKCPNPGTHILWSDDDKVPKDHIDQVIGGLYVTGRKWADFISFDPRIAPPHNMNVKRIWAKDVQEELKEMDLKLTAFKQTMIEKLKGFDYEFEENNE